MRTKQLIVIIAAIGFAFTAGYSQKHHGRFDVNDQIEHRLDKMNEIVKFTGDQRTQVQTLFNDMVKKKKDAYCTHEMGSDGMQKAMKNIRKEKEAGLKKILTKDQMNLWEKNAQEHHADKKGKHKGKGKSMDDRINTKLDKMNEIVKFTGTQREDLKKLFNDLAKRGKDIMCANEVGSDAFKSEMKKLNEERKEGMKKILTDGQMQLWKDHKKTQHTKKGNGEKKGTDTLEK